MLTLHRNKTKGMKKLIILIAALTLPLLAGAQAQINTKKVKVGDFTEKVTKIVLNGNSIYDTVIKEEITARWRISPYEFCTLEEFENLKGNDQYYFLIMTQAQFKKESSPGIQFLTLVKGGQGAEKGIDDMLEVVSMPFAAVEFPSGREFIFLPALLDIIQDHTLASMEKDINAYGGLSNYSSNIHKSDDMFIVFSEDDLNDEITEELIEERFDTAMMVTDEESADEYIAGNTPGTLISYVVAPFDPVAGSYCYKMLIDAQTHKLYYYRKQRITKTNGPGFLKEDILKITATR